jgi:hypothetical protein
MKQELSASLQRARDVFQRYKFKGRLEVCRCKVCVSPAVDQALARTPRDDMSAELLSEYTHSAHPWTDGVADEFRFLLPRYFELIVADDIPSQFGIECCLDRLRHAAYRQNWPQNEADVIDEFFLALFQDCLSSPIEFVGDDFEFYSSHERAEQILCMVANAGGDIHPLLLAWETMEGQNPALRLAHMVGTADWAKDRLRCSWWLQSFRPDVEDAMNAVVAWLSRPTVRERLERACLEESEPEIAEILSYAESIVGRLARG